MNLGRSSPADIDVRANADTPAARRARRFEAQGIGLCRTEPYVFDARPA